MAGQRIMQAAGDAFLGWHRTDRHRRSHPRLLRASAARLEGVRDAWRPWTPKGLRRYAGVCAWTLARAHARSGDRIAIAAYLGDDDRLPQALADFAHSYADLNEQDHATFCDGRRRTASSQEREVAQHDQASGLLIVSEAAPAQAPDRDVRGRPPAARSSAPWPG